MTPRRRLKIAPCPRPGCKGNPAVQDAGAERDVQVVCPCGWMGPPSTKGPRQAILAWNRRSDAEAEIRGAMKAADWVGNILNDWHGDLLREAIERGEVLPAKPEPWIVSKPGKMGGAPCVRGTRIPVAILQPLAAQFSLEQILVMYPGLTSEGLSAALAYKLPAKAKKGARKR